MFYCDDCATKKVWPKTLFKSRGNCEVCDKKDQVCNEVPAKDLPEDVIQNPDGSVSKTKQG